MPYSEPKKSLGPFIGDKRTNYCGTQFSLLYESADEERYLASFSFVGFTVLDDGVFVLSTRFVNKPKKVTDNEMINRFLCATRRPLCRWMIYVGDKADIDADYSVISGLVYFDPQRVLQGKKAIWGTMCFVDGVEVLPPVQIGVPVEFVSRVRSLFEECLPVVRYSSDESICLQRQHVVFEASSMKFPGPFSYGAREYLQCGGHPLIANFDGLTFFKMDGYNIVCLSGMVMGENGHGVGQFGSVLPPRVTKFMFREGHRKGSARKKNAGVDCDLRPVYPRRGERPIYETVGTPDLLVTDLVVYDLGVNDEGKNKLLVSTS